MKKVNDKNVFGSAKEAISKEYVGGYKKYIKQIKNLDLDPVSFEKWTKFYSMKAVRRNL